MTGRAMQVVVVAYHAPERLAQCLAPLERAVEVTVVDNSTSAAVRAVAERYGARYIDPGSNLGFAAGVNVALRRLRDTPQDVLLLNPDAVLSLEALDALSVQMHRPSHERVAAVVPRLLGPDGAEQRVIWPFPTPAGAWIEALGLGGSRAQDSFVIGAVLLLRWEALREIGLFDERFFLYAEEADWQRRGRDLGWRSSVCAEAWAEHIGAGTGGNPRRREALFHAAQETYIRKHFGSAGWLSYRAATLAGAGVRVLLLAGERRSEAARRARLYAKGPRRVATLLSRE